MNQFMIYFDFTTVHRGSKFVGRSGQVGLETEGTLQKVTNDETGIQSFVRAFIDSEKPKWNVFMIQIKEIKQLQTNE